MSNIKKLLEGVEVEWKTLGEITNILRGKRLTRNLLSANDKYPVFHGGLDTVMIINRICWSISIIIDQQILL